MNALARIQENLAVGRPDACDDVITLRVFLDNAPGAPAMDFAGFNRAYRQFFANVNLHTGAVIPQSPRAPPRRPRRWSSTRSGRRARRSRWPACRWPGWLVEVEAVAKRPSGRGRDWDR